MLSVQLVTMCVFWEECHSKWILLVGDGKLCGVSKGRCASSLGAFVEEGHFHSDESLQNEMFR